MADSRVRIDTSMDSRGIIRGVRDAARKVQYLADEYKKTAGAVKEQEAAVAKLKRQYDEAAAAAKETHTDPKQLEAMRKASEDARNAYLEQNEALEKMQQSLEQNEKKTKSAIEEALVKRKDYNEAVRTQAKAEAALKASGDESTEAMRESVKVATEKAEALRKQSESAETAAALAKETNVEDFESSKTAIYEQAQAVAELRGEWSKAGTAYREYRDADSRSQSDAAAEAEKLAEKLGTAKDSLTALHEEAGKLEAAMERTRDSTGFGYAEQAKQAKEDITAFEAALASMNSKLAEEQDPVAITALRHEIHAAEAAFEKFRSELSKPVADIMRVQELQNGLADLQSRYDAIMEGGKTPEAFEELKSSLRETEREYRAVESANNDLIAAYEAAGEKMAALYRDSGPDAQQYIEARAEVEAMYERLTLALEKQDALAAKAGELTVQLAGAKLTPEAAAEAERLAEQIREAKENLAAATSEAGKLGETMSGASSEGAEEASASMEKIGLAAQAAGNMVSSAFGKIRAAISAIAAGAARAARGLLSMARNLIGLERGGRRASNGLERLWNRLKAIALTAFVFSVIRRGLNALTRDMGRMLRANESFARSFNAIQVNMLTAFAPLWETIEPAILRFMDLLARFTAVLAQFMATLFGRTVQQARDSAKGLYEQAKGLEAVGAAAEDARKQVHGFDQLNRQSDDSGGSGAGIGGLDFDVDTSMLSWVDELAEKVKNLFAEGDFAYWFGLGAAAAAKFSTVLRKIPWDSIRRGAKAAGENIAGLIGGFVSNADVWESVTYGIAQGFNTVIDYLRSFASNFPWVETGKAIGAGISKFFSTFEWARLAATINAWALGILDLIINTLAAVDWGKIGRDFSSFINGIRWRELFEKTAAAIGMSVNAIMSVIGNFIRNLDWRELGGSIAAGINKLFSTVNLGEAGQAVSNLALGLLTLFRTAIQETDWKAVGSSIKDFLKNIDWRGVLKEAAGLIKDALAAAFDISPLLGIGVVLAPIISALAKFAGFLLSIHGLLAQFVGAGKAATLILKGLKIAFGAVLGPVALVITGIIGLISIISNLVKIVKAIGEDFWGKWADGMAVIWRGITGGVTAAVNFIKNALSSIVGFFQGIIDKIKSIFGIRSPSTVMTDIGISIMQGLINGISWLIDMVLGLFSGLWDGIKNVFASAGEWFAGIFAAAFEGIRKAWEGAAEWFARIWGNITGAFGGAAEWFSGVFSTAWGKVREAWGSVSGFFSGVWEGIKGAFGNITGWFRDKFSEAWQAVKNVFSKGGEVFAGIKDGILDGLKAVINALIDGINKVVKTPFDGINAAFRKLRGINIAGIKPFSFLGELNVPQIPRLARGGIVDSATLAMIGEKGREAVVPLSQNAEWMAPMWAVKRELETANGILERIAAAAENGHIIAMNERELGRAVIRTVRGLQNQVGQNLIYV